MIMPCLFSNKVYSLLYIYTGAWPGELCHANTLQYAYTVLQRQILSLSTSLYL